MRGRSGDRPLAAKCPPEWDWGWKRVEVYTRVYGPIRGKCDKVAGRYIGKFVKIFDEEEEGDD